jgi:hypothetical protein
MSAMALTRAQLKSFAKLWLKYLGLRRRVDTLRMYSGDGRHFAGEVLKLGVERPDESVPGLWTVTRSPNLSILGDVQDFAEASDALYEVVREFAREKFAKVWLAFGLDLRGEVPMQRQVAGHYLQTKHGPISFFEAVQIELGIPAAGATSDLQLYDESTVRGHIVTLRCETHAMVKAYYAKNPTSVGGKK